MKKLFSSILFFTVILRGGIWGQRMNEIIPLTSPSDSIIEKQGWQLIFSDEFEGNALDELKWWPQTGTHASELQYYTPRKENIYVSDGLLHLRAIKENFKDSLPYTSGMVFSSIEFGKGNFIEIRCKIPKGRGLWPAFWFWSGHNEIYQELDVFEFWSHDTKRYCITNHWNKVSGEPIQSAPYWISPKTKEGKKIDLSTTFITYSVYWDDKNILFLLNNQLVAKIKDNIPPNPFPIILNLAIDSGKTKRPDKKTIFPAEFLVDYVRVYKRENAVSELIRR